jgi:predicted transcriptional regulator
VSEITLANFFRRIKKLNFMDGVPMTAPSYSNRRSIMTKSDRLGLGVLSEPMYDNSLTDFFT